IVPEARVQPGATVGPGCSLENATEGALLVTMMGFGVVEARVIANSTLEPCPGGTVDGVSVKEATVAGSWVPPGLRVSSEGTETRVRPFPVVGSGVNPMVRFKGTSVGALTTPVGRSKLTEVASAASDSGTPSQSGGVREAPPVWPT